MSLSHKLHKITNTYLSEQAEKFEEWFEKNAMRVCTEKAKVGLFVAQLLVPPSIHVDFEHVTTFMRKWGHDTGLDVTTEHVHSHGTIIIIINWKDIGSPGGIVSSMKEIYENMGPLN